MRCINEYARRIQEKQSDPQKPPILLVDTHNHAHLRRERHDAYVGDDCETDNTAVVSLSLSVELPDWDDAVKYSASDPSSFDDAGVAPPVADWTLFGLGIHPWYLEGLAPTEEWKKRLEVLLDEHPSAIVGEIGLCKMAKCARHHPEGKTRGFELQRSVLATQLEIAIQYQRPVSIHCVQQHGVFMDVLQQVVKRPERGTDPWKLVPPAMAMHSFTGTAHHVKALLTWEATLFGEGPNDKKNKSKSKGNPNDNSQDVGLSRRRRPLVYFGFSHIVNYGMCTSDKARRQGWEAVRAVPLDRLLVESDVHHPSDVASGTAGAVAYIAWALERPLEEVAEITARNGLNFLQSHIKLER